MLRVSSWLSLKFESESIFIDYDSMDRAKRISQVKRTGGSTCWTATCCQPECLAPPPAPPVRSLFSFTLRLFFFCCRNFIEWKGTSDSIDIASRCCNEWLWVGILFQSFWTGRLSFIPVKVSWFSRDNSLKIQLEKCHQFLDHLTWSCFNLNEIEPARFLFRSL